MHYVYIIQSITYPDKLYVGQTSNPEKRLSDHNCGTTSHTKDDGPWKMLTLIGFDDKVKALAFEKYLKSGSGRAFRERHLV